MGDRVPTRFLIRDFQFHVSLQHEIALHSHLPAFTLFPPSTEYQRSIRTGSRTQRQNLSIPSDTMLLRPQTT